MIARMLFFIKTLLFILLLAPGAALAQSDSVSTALASIDDFHNTALAITNDLPSSSATKDFVSGSDVIYKMSMAKLKSLRSTMEPSLRRHRQAVDIFEKYCDAQTGLFIPLSKSSDNSGAQRIAAKEAELQKLRQTMLESFNDSLKHETYKPVKPTPMPETNRPPYEKDPEHKGGVFDR